MKLVTVSEYAEQEVALIAETISTSSQIKILKIVQLLTEADERTAAKTLSVEEILEAVKKVFLMLPLSPITGVESEWLDLGNDITGKPIQYNKRLMPLIIRGNKCYITDAVRFIDDSNNNEPFYGEVSGITSIQEVTKFPFTPNYIDIEVIRVYSPTVDGKSDYYYALLTPSKSKAKVLEAYPKS